MNYEDFEIPDLSLASKQYLTQSIGGYEPTRKPLHGDCCEPKFLRGEPTTALDLTIKQQINEHSNLQKNKHMA